MRNIKREIVNKFARSFAGSKKGFSGKEITDYLVKYNSMVKLYEHYGFTPSREELFIESVYMLLPKEQYYALTDLCLNPPEMKYEIPGEEERKTLMAELHSYYNIEPIGLAFSKLREHIFREDWFIAYNRIEENPASAITSARTLLETIFKTIISERNNTPDNSGDISKLLKEAEDVLNFQRATNQEQHKILGGLAGIINGVAGLSNNDGDRHGLVEGKEITSKEVASLVVNACGTIGMFFIELHLFNPLNK